MVLEASPKREENQGISTRRSDFSLVSSVLNNVTINILLCPPRDKVKSAPPFSLSLPGVAQTAVRDGRSGEAAGSQVWGAAPAQELPTTSRRGAGLKVRGVSAAGRGRRGRGVYRLCP